MCRDNDLIWHKANTMGYIMNYVMHIRSVECGLWAQAIDVVYVYSKVKIGVAIYNGHTVVGRYAVYIIKPY